MIDGCCVTGGICPQAGGQWPQTGGGTSKGCERSVVPDRGRGRRQRADVAGAKGADRSSDLFSCFVLAKIWLGYNLGAHVVLRNNRFRYCEITHVYSGTSKAIQFGVDAAASTRKDCQISTTRARLETGTKKAREKARTGSMYDR